MWGNKNKRHTIVNKNEGMEVCLGPDGKGCGHVLHTNRFTPCYVPVSMTWLKSCFLHKPLFLVSTSTGVRNSNVSIIVSRLASVDMVEMMLSLRTLIKTNKAKKPKIF